MDCSTGGDGLVATADIKSMDDLAGKTVALDKSATSYFFFLQAFADSNITEDQINIVEMGNDEAGEAFNDTSKEDNVYDIGCMAASFWVEKGYMQSEDIKDFFSTLDIK